MGLKVDLSLAYLLLKHLIEYFLEGLKALYK